MEKAKTKKAKRNHDAAARRLSGSLCYRCDGERRTNCGSTLVGDFLKEIEEELTCCICHNLFDDSKLFKTKQCRSQKYKLRSRGHPALAFLSFTCLIEFCGGDMLVLSALARTTLA